MSGKMNDRAPKIDWEAEASKESTAGDVLVQLTELVAQQLEAQDKIAALTDQLTSWTVKLQEVSEKQIPDLLEATGLSELRLADKTKVIVATSLHVSTTGKYRDIINAWLERTGHDDVIKDEVKVPFGKGQGARVDALISILKDSKLQYDRTRAVNPQTLGALLRELMEAGEDVPLDELGVFVRKFTKLEVPK